MQGLGESIQTLAALSYANDGLIASLESACLQESFGVLSGLFEQVGLRTNKGKMVIMDFRPYHTPHAWSTEAYTQQNMRHGIYYSERLLQNVHYPECGYDLAYGLLAAHKEQHQGVGLSKATSPPPSYPPM